jgi:GABA(A) receptor-associated protein
MNTPKPDEIERLRKKYPDRIPILLIKGNATTTDIPKKKFLVPSAITFGEFIQNIRYMFKLKPEKAMYFYIDNTLPSNSNTISTIYATHKSVDGMLHVVYSEENTFG